MHPEKNRQAGTSQSSKANADEGNFDFKMPENTFTFQDNRPSTQQTVHLQKGIKNSAILQKADQYHQMANGTVSPSPIPQPLNNRQDALEDETKDEEASEPIQQKSTVPSNGPIQRDDTLLYIIVAMLFAFLLSRVLGGKGTTSNKPALKGKEGTSPQVSKPSKTTATSDKKPKVDEIPQASEKQDKVEQAKVQAEELAQDAEVSKIAHKTLESANKEPKKAAAKLAENKEDAHKVETKAKSRRNKSKSSKKRNPSPSPSPPMLEDDSDDWTSTTKSKKKSKWQHKNDRWWKTLPNCNNQHAKAIAEGKGIGKGQHTSDHRPDICLAFQTALLGNHCTQLEGGKLKIISTNNTYDVQLLEDLTLPMTDEALEKVYQYAVKNGTFSKTKPKQNRPQSNRYECSTFPLSNGGTFQLAKPLVVIIDSFANPQHSDPGTAFIKD